MPINPLHARFPKLEYKMLEQNIDFTQNLIKISSPKFQISQGIPIVIVYICTRETTEVSIFGTLLPATDILK